MTARVQSIDWLPALIALPLFAAVGLLAGLDPRLGIFAALGLLFVLVALTDLAAALVVFVAVVFAESSPVGGAALSATKLAGLLLAVGWLARLATRPSSRESLIFTAHPGFTYLLALFLTWIAVSMTWAPSNELAIEQGSAFLLLAVLYVIVFTAIRTRRQAMIVIGGFVTGITTAAAFGLATRPTSDAVEGPRLVSTIGDPNFLAAMLVAGIALATAGFLVTRHRPGLRIGAGFAIAICFAAFMMTGSRGGIVGLAVALVVAIVFAGRWRARMALAATILVTAAVGYYALYAPPEITERLGSATQGEVTQRDTRSTLWMVGWRMVKDNPVAGVGIGGFEVESPKYVLEPGTSYRTDRVIDDPGYAHNSYLGPLAELGVVGLAMFLAIIGFSVTCAARAARRFERNGDPSMEALSRGLVVAAIGMLTAGFFISAEASKIIWLLLAMGPAMLAVARSADEDDQEPAGPSSSAVAPAANPS